MQIETGFVKKSMKFSEMISESNGARFDVVFQKFHTFYGMQKKKAFAPQNTNQTLALATTASTTIRSPA